MSVEGAWLETVFSYIVVILCLQLHNVMCVNPPAFPYGLLEVYYADIYRYTDI